MTEEGRKTGLFTKDFLEELSQKIANDVLQEYLSAGFTFSETIITLARLKGLLPRHIYSGKSEEQHKKEMQELKEQVMKTIQEHRNQTCQNDICN